MKLTLASLLLLGTLGLPQASFKVSGRLAGNTTARGVVLRGLGADRQPVERQGTLMPDGSFEIVGVPPGSFSVSPVPSNPFGRPEAVTLKTADVRDVTVQNPVIRQIKGRIVTPDGVGIPALVFLVPPLPLASASAPNPSLSPDLLGEIQMILNTPSEVPLKPSSDGTFSVSLPEGERRISIAKSAGYEVATFTYGSQNLLTNPLRIAPGTLSDISIVLKKSK